MCGASRNHVGNKARLRWSSIRRATPPGVESCHRAMTVMSPSQNPPGRVYNEVTVDYKTITRRSENVTLNQRRVTDPADQDPTSEDVDDIDAEQVSEPNVSDERDVTAADDDMPATPADEVAGGQRKPGRPTKSTADVQATICARYAAGVPIELAARSAGISPSTLYNWKATGERALARESQGLSLTERDRACLDFVVALSEAEAEHLAGLRAGLVAAATSHRKTRTVLTLTYKIVDKDILRDENGDPVWIPTYVSEVIEEPNVPAQIALFNEGMQRASRAETQELKASAAEEVADPTTDLSVERRLAASIRVRREEIDEERDAEVEKRVSQRLHLVGTTTSAPAVVPLTTDDDDYDPYALWAPFLNAYPGPETPDIPTPDMNP